jgi:hypothetical protein
MADTSPDVFIPIVWTDAFVVSGITTTASLSILNKSRSYILMQITAGQPAAEDNSGILITDISKKYASITTDANVSGVWLKSLGSSALVNISEDSQ